MFLSKIHKLVLSEKLLIKSFQQFNLLILWVSEIETIHYELPVIHRTYCNAEIIIFGISYLKFKLREFVK
jgi:hypothetical protein